MRLKKIKLAGFKSFVDPTSIPFPGDMTAVVGPNGCGKSNVIDAVRWVLGESSAKNLRGDAMTDVIFNGSSARKPVGQCSVELVFDNSSGRIGGEYARYNELAVKRLVTRDATSTYFLNGVKCRRRDVTDLFLGTGLGPRSYAIIEQGMISRLIESKPQELRVFIEEAAGISRYKERRRETENRIRHTVDNLDRLEDVRQELGQQLEKLQRQAAAATRYKTLKSSERSLKSELAAIRWLKHSHHIERLEKDQHHQQSELDALIARQRGDEAGMETYRQQRDDLKQEIDSLQQALFTATTAITRIEQNTLHSQQRSQQIDAELRELQDRKAALTSSLNEAKEAKALAESQRNHLEPEREMAQARLEQAQQSREDAEQALRTFNSESREHEQRYHELKQQVQSCHGQIQSTMSMQLRTSQRVTELKEERASLIDDSIKEQRDVLLESLEQSRAMALEAEATLSARQQTLRETGLSLAAEQSALREQENVAQQVVSKIAALEALQEDASRTQEDIMAGLLPLWQSLHVMSGMESTFERVLAHWQHPMLTAAHSLATLSHAGSSLPRGKPVFITQMQSIDAAPGTLASYIQTGSCPAVFNDIFVSDTIDDALAMVPKLANHQSVIVKDGPWMAGDWLVSGTVSQSEGALYRAAQLEELENMQATLQKDIEVASNRTMHQQEQYDAQSAQVETAKQELEQARSQSQQIQHQLEVVDMQLQQNASRAQKLSEDLFKQEQLLESEEQQLEALSEKLEELETSILDHETHIQDVQQTRERLEEALSAARTLTETLTQDSHTFALKLQQSESQLEMYAQQVVRNNSQLLDYQARLNALTEEKEKLSQPIETQQAQLQGLLEEKAEKEDKRRELQLSLDDVEQLLKEAEQGQQGLTQQIQQRQSAIESIRLEIEGYRVRATSVLEQLQETGQALKPILASLPEDADEQVWQAELEKTTAAVSRLGAVNLAAVEEYETQSQRKSHLDSQHDDLVEALETLQSAIRKIDKETRTRFSNTFEQVNEDLKQLFPKVFGGGSAYLALTDDDLLETGVTIMARPPGKKNSTIHLLSGGEKALTALSLVFAIFRLNPAPFCLLDEVDAPLDDANVGRFCNLVSEMSQTVQFIYITHNKIAMEMASHLTGVTMAEPGVSRMVAVDVDEAIAFAEA
ncbi:chromosome segregation protein SMC [Alteromonas sp. H39]|uniref:chromosome segregation protein SMC n=1 Tax=Alteromonas sp. H39 TaxID=3389876 RepID=UPI0039E12D6A